MFWGLFKQPARGPDSGAPTGPQPQQLSPPVAPLLSQGSFSPVKAALENLELIHALDKATQQAERLLTEARSRWILRPKAELVRSLEGVVASARLAQELLFPSRFEGSYRAFQRLETAPARLERAKAESAIYPGYHGALSAREHELISRGAAIQQSVNSTVLFYTTRVAPELFESFFSLRYLVEPARLPHTLHQSIAERATKMALTWEMVAQASSPTEGGIQRAFERLATQAAGVYEILGDLSDRLRFDPRAGIAVGAAQGQRSLA